MGFLLSLSIYVKKVMSIINIITEEIESLYSANFPEFGERLHTLNEIEEELENLLEYGEGTAEPYDFEFDNTSNNEVHYYFSTEKFDYDVQLNQISIGVWYLQFGKIGGDTKEVTNEFKQNQIMTTLIKIVNNFVDRFKPNEIRIEPSKNDEKDNRRFNMYMAFIKNNMRNDYLVDPRPPYIIIHRKSQIPVKNQFKI